jgi:hypothetical protein
MAKAIEFGPALVIVYRQLVLFHGTDQGILALLPSEDHDGTIRDVRSDSVVKLSDARITLLANGRQLNGAEATVVRNSRLLSFNEIAGKEVRPLEELPVLNATVAIPGGTLTAFPSSAFPEFADAKWKFPKPDGSGHVEHMVTDTCLFHLPLDEQVTYHLLVKSPRQEVQIEVPGSEGRRFEVKNADRKLENPPANPFDLRDYKRLAELLEISFLPPLPPSISRLQPLDRMCDEIVVCPTGYCGNPDKKAKKRP